jgi:hypothetical protein
MARRLFIGGNNGQFTLKQSMSGYDALTASPSNLIFDADAYPGVILNSGKDVYIASTQTADPAVRQFPHGCGKKPGMVAAVARQINSYTGDNDRTPVDWTFFLRGSSLLEQQLGNPYMDKKPCSPWKCVKYYTNNAQAYNSGGWWFSYDASYIFVTTWQVRDILVDWVAFDI